MLIPTKYYIHTVVPTQKLEKLYSFENAEANELIAVELKRLMTKSKWEDCKDLHENYKALGANQEILI